MYLKMKVYKALNLDGNLVCQGYSQKELADLLGVHKSSVQLAVMYGYVIKKKWQIVMEDLDNPIQVGTPRGKMPKVKPKKKTKEELYLEYLNNHLSRFGNTCSNRDPMTYLEKFKEMYGYGYKARKVKSSQGKRGRPSYFYILEAIE